MSSFHVPLYTCYRKVTPLLVVAFISSRLDEPIGLQIRYVEVRVGNVNAGAVTPLGRRICANALCLNTGGGEAQESLASDCSGGPLEGRFLTLQRHLIKDDLDYPPLVIAELDVEFYEE